MNSILTLFSNSVFIYSLFIGFYSLFKNIKKHINWIFFLLSVSFAIWSFGFSNLNIHHNYVTALFWAKFGISGLFLLSATFLNFSIILTGLHNKLNQIILYIIIYLPVIFLISYLIFKTEVLLDSNKYQNIFNNIHFRNSFFLIFFSESIYFLLGIFFLVYWRLTALKKNEKKQANIVLVSICIPVIINNILFFLFKTSFSNKILEITLLASLLSIIGFWYAIFKYKFMVLTPKFALNQILYNMHDLILMTDPEGFIIFVNEKLKNALGFLENEIIKKSVNTILKTPKNLFYKKKTDKYKQFIIEETQIIKKDNQIIPIQLYCIPEYDKNKKLLGYLLICHDISDKKKLENQIAEFKIMANSLFEKDKEYKRILEAISDGIIVVDKELNIILLNQKFLNIYQNIKDRDLLNKNLNEVFNDKKDINFINDFNIILNNGKIIINEKMIHIKDEDRFFEIWKIPILINNEVEKIASIFRDISDKKKNEEINIRTEKINSIGVLAAGIAHDFNNILTGILGNINLINFIFKNKENIDLNEIKELLYYSEKATKHAKTLTSQLLTFSKGGSPILRSGSIIELIKESASFCLSGSNIDFKIEAEEDLWSVKFDENQIANVLNNIFINSKQSIKENGEIIVLAENFETTKINHFFPFKNGKYVLIQIKDNGIGIKKENLNKIFDPYFSTKTDGNGLGLATTFSIIQKHNGFIDVDSKEGKYTIVRIYFPAILTAKSVEMVEDFKYNKRKIGINKKKILLMDDSKHIQSLSEKIFKHLGHELTLTSNVKDTIDIYKSTYKTDKEFDIVILDLTIKGGPGGKEAIQKLLKINQNIKAIVCSGYSNDTILNNYEQYGFKASINKPYSIEEISKKIESI